MKKQILFLVLSLIFLAAGAYAIWFFFINSSESETSQNIPLSTGTSYKNNISANTKPQSSELSVKGANDTNSNSTKQNTLPEPNDFKVYEKYAKEQNALYVDIEVGTGQEASSGDNVAMLYQGWLTNGQLFDQSKQNEEGLWVPFTFQIGGSQVIPGWEQSIAGMKVGGKRRLVIPSTVGYGATGQGSIPPNSMLIFDVQLVEIQKQ